MKNKLLTLLIGLSMIFSLIPPVMADENVITISTAEEFAEFAQKCTYDAFSEGKTVNLTADIAFTKDNFKPIPTFGGTFNGNGYTLSGIKFKDKGSYQGVFRYVRQNARVSNLNVKANFTPSGSKSFVGGIVGENSGTIENCSFDGMVKGENVIGGIAGENADYGKIITCNSSGSVSGENSTGGIVGKNSGLIQNCTNNSAVNTVYEEKKKSITDIDTDKDAIIENYKNSEEQNEEESPFGHTDTGGIAGYSNGVIQGSINNASVGYQHIGYNVGGIVGRQSGYVLGCENHALIRGRKDVGGIVGQAEPYILLDVSEDIIKDTQKELNNLNTMINNFITDTDNLGDDTEKHLSEISKYAKNAQTNAENIVNQGIDFADDNINEINVQSAIISDTLDRLGPVLEHIEDGGNTLGDALDKLADTLDEIDIKSPELSEEVDEISDALTEISKAERSTQKATARFDKAMDDLDDAIKISDKTAIKKAFADMSTAIRDMIRANEKITDALSALLNSRIMTIEDGDENESDSSDLLIALKSIKDNIDVISTSLKTIQKSIDTIILNTKFDFSELKSAANNMQYSIEYIGNSVMYITRGLGDLGDAIKDFSDKFEEYTDYLSDEITEITDNLSECVDDLSYATDDITDAISDMKNIIEDLANEEPLELVKFGDDFRNESEGLFDSLSGISSEIDKMRNTLSNGQDKISDNLTLINNQFNLVMNLLADRYEEFKDESHTVDDIFLDTSDENIESTKQGKVAGCSNFADVEADRNTGGIAGSVAIEYSKDPEDDVEKPYTLNFTYRTKAVLQGCINDGIIKGKKDCTGGVVGFGEIGTVYECENYGNVESTDGNYVGGVAGKSDATIRKSYSKSSVVGNRYIGGIAGKADALTYSHAIASVTGEENTGAICGDTDSMEKFIGNSFTDNGIGGIDGISYKGKAEPTDFEKLKTIKNVPSRFIGFTVKFVADNKIVSEQNIEYGEETRKIKYPDIPSKSGCFGTWEKPEEKIVQHNIELECIYKPYVTVISSEEKNSNGKLALALAEGEFTDLAEIHISENKQNAEINNSKDDKIYDISLVNTDIQENDEVTLRILNEDKRNVTAKQMRNGNWEEIKTTARGKYVIIKAKGNKSTIWLEYGGRKSNIIIIITFVLLLLTLLYLTKIKFLGKKK